MVFGFGNKYYKKNVPKKYKKLFPKSKMASSVGQLVKRVNYMRSLINVERKIIEPFNALNQLLPNVDTVNAPYYLNTLSQGAGENQRVGNSIKLASMHVRIMFNANSGSTVPQNIRILIVKDLNRNVQQNGTAGPVPTLGNVLRPDNYTTGQVNNIIAPLSDVTSGRYQVVASKIFTVDRGARAGYLFDRYIKTNCDLKYATNSATDPNDGYYMWIFSDVSTYNASYLPNMTGFIRCKYIDN